MKCLLIDRKFRIPRIWSNNELNKFANQFIGKIVNVSGWKDDDKRGLKYKDYYPNLSEYWITNYKSEAKGFQGNLENEIFINLEEELSDEYLEKFDVVFNHTVLEHVFEVDKAFSNLCKMSKDIIIVIVPFLQEQHADYGDYWRFTPIAIEKLFKKNNVDLIYINYNDDSHNSIYIFAIGSKKKNKWQNIIDDECNKINVINKHMIGMKNINNGIVYNYIEKIKNIIKSFL